ncbi:MAG: hypothetical protein P4M11_13260 [Candidatus Pacebacteria bacterium]|nr:hypothetical protein [Candidatus Paceibacterota bacterium]
MNQRQRLVGLYILYEIYLHENVKTTPFYQLVLDLLARADTLHVAEQKLLTDFLKSVPKVGKLTPSEYIMEAERLPAVRFQQDLEPYRKAQAENMPRTALHHSASLSAVVRDEDKTKEPVQETYKYAP